MHEFLVHCTLKLFL